MNWRTGSQNFETDGIGSTKAKRHSMNCEMNNKHKNSRLLTKVFLSDTRAFCDYVWLPESESVAVILVTVVLVSRDSAVDSTALGSTQFISGPWYPKNRPTATEPGQNAMPFLVYSCTWLGRLHVTGNYWRQFLSDFVIENVRQDVAQWTLQCLLPRPRFLVLVSSSPRLLVSSSCPSSLVLVSSSLSSCALFQAGAEATTSQNWLHHKIR
jgi:hypothetical protein